LLAGGFATRLQGLAAVTSALAVYQLACGRQRPFPAVQSSRQKGSRVALANLGRRNFHVGDILQELATGEHDILAWGRVTRNGQAVDALLPETTYAWRR
jgi:hypothetical protein